VACVAGNLAEPGAYSLLAALAQMAASLVGGRLRLVAPMLCGYISKLMTHVFDMENLTTLISQLF